MKRRTRLLLIGLCLLALSPIVWIVYNSVSLIWAKPGDAIDYQQALLELGEAQWDATETNRWDEFAKTIGMYRELAWDLQLAQPERTDEFEPATALHILQWTNDTDELFYYKGFSDRVHDREWSQRSMELAQRVVERAREEGLFDSLKSLSTAEHINPPKGTFALHSVYNSRVSGEAKAFMWANIARMHRALLDGDEAAFVDIVDQSLFLAEAIASHPHAMSQMVGCRIANMTLESICDASVHGLSGDTYEAIIGVIEERLPTPSPSIGIEAERLMVLEFVQSEYTSDGRVILSEFHEGSLSPPSKLNNMRGVDYPRKRQVEELVERVSKACREQIDASRQERKAILNQLSAELHGLAPEYAVWQIILDSVRYRCKKTINEWHERQTRTNGTIALLYLRQFELAHGRPPNSLDELEGWCGWELPDDDYSNDGSFGYRVLDEPDEFGRTYLLYTFGRDGVDSDGLEGEGDYGAFSWKSDGYDLIFNTRTSRDSFELPE